MSKNCTLLLVEDTASLAILYHEYLRDLNVTVKRVDNGTDALSAIADDKNPIDLILLDLNLPDIDGISILKKLKSSKRKIPVVVITANTTIDKAVEAMQQGAKDYLTKPFTRERLNTTVKNTMVMAQLERDFEKLSKMVQS